MGYLRFCLAMMVAYSHVGWQIANLNPGVIAVIGFYVVSGMAMAQMWDTQYAPHLKTHTWFRVALAFYLDRFLRLWPAYLLIILATWLSWLLGFIESPFLSREPTVIDVLNNIFIIPLNFYMWNLSDQFVLIPPAWSLGAELQFYCLVPLLLIRSLTPIYLISLVIALLASIGFLSSDIWGYRLLPGVLCLFMTGIFLSRFSVKRQIWHYALLIFIGLVVTWQELWLLAYNRERAIGWCLVMGLIYFLRNKQLPGDRWMGDLAYPIFLGHFLVWWLLGQPEWGYQMIYFSLGVVLLASFLVKWVDHPIHQQRRIFRAYLLT
jgi:peptidoglycan/LPS O-acetylase OafA/YrhL